MTHIDRPGGWVKGIGWVARLSDLDPYDIARNPDRRTAQVRIHRSAGVTPDWGYVTVTAWADGSEPTIAGMPTDVPPEFVDWLIEQAWNHDYKLDGSYCGWSNGNNRLDCKGCSETHPHARTIKALARSAGYKIQYDMVRDTKATAARKAARS